MTRKARGRLPRHLQRALQPTASLPEVPAPLPPTIPAIQAPPAVVRPPNALVLASSVPSFGSAFGPPSASSPQTNLPARIPSPPRPSADEVLGAIGEQTLIGESAQGGQEFWITLKQDVLGGLHLRISIHGKDVSATLLAPSQAIKYLLKQRIPELKDHLRSRGFRVTAMEILVQEMPPPPDDPP